MVMNVGMRGNVGNHGREERERIKEENWERNR